jgi:hypothetical protein
VKQQGIPPTPAPEQLGAWSIEDFAKWSGLGRTKIFGYLKDGSLTAKRAGKRTLILRAEGERFINNLPDREQHVPPRRKAS